MRLDEKEVYTLAESRQILKVSQSTMLRLIKKGIIRMAKVGKQYRILGKELLRVVSPKLEEEAIPEKVTITRYSPRESTFELLAYIVKDNGHKVERAELAKAISYMGEFFMRHAKDSSSNSAGSATKKPAK